MPLKKCILIRIIKCAASIRKNLGFEYYEIKTLCNQIQKYINKPRIANYLFAIYPNSATYKRGFSTL
ncbi:hypothetical protein RhiirA5_437930 [Rhizophagus irregularis]|uniref:Uncharacterized protein n=1 Tax=Rhizophagus irregularis TaxID=588596 RepID=A0A2N0NJV5_9GLOM|nr:hypothetical protein RhiirA5_437930 [Rhizophagus irregularis]PKC53512.1 hypothetical protein RhiirA1_479152 [Rhizophagus irregularis]